MAEKFDLLRISRRRRLNYRTGLLLSLLCGAILSTGKGRFSVSCFAFGSTHHQSKHLLHQKQGREGHTLGIVSSVIPPITAVHTMKRDRLVDKRNNLSALASSSVSSGDDDLSDLSVRGGGSSQPRKNDKHNEESATVGMWPCMDELDKRIIKIALPCIANFAINPLIGAVDLFWINRMSNPLAVAGQAAANQVFTSAFWLASFMPSVTATLVSEENAKGNKSGLQDAVCQALIVAFIISLLGTPILLLQPDKVLSAVLKDGAPALEYARPYLLIRSFAFLPSLISLTGFAAFRGILDTVTPMKISSFANVFNALLDPFLIFTVSMGVSGAAVATLAAEVISAVLFMVLMRKMQMFQWNKLFTLPRWSNLKRLLKGGAALQLRNVALNVTFLAVQRVTQSIDDTGVAAAAHALAIQVFQVGGIVLLALSSVAQTVIPNEMYERIDPGTGKRTGGAHAAKVTVNRLMSWGFILGVILGALQMLLLPFLQKSTPLKEVRTAALIPSYLASVYQIMNGLVFIGEGVMVGCGSYMQLSLSTVVATMGALYGLKVLPPLFGLTGVWMSFGIWNLLRLAGVWLHQTRNGPLAPRNMKKIN